MKLMKHLFSSLFIAGAMLSTEALAEEKTAEQAQSQTQVQQQTAVNINTASASEIQKALIGIGAKKAEAIVQYLKNTVVSLRQNNYLKYKALVKLR